MKKLMLFLVGMLISGSLYAWQSSGWAPGPGLASDANGNYTIDGGLYIGGVDERIYSRTYPTSWFDLNDYAAGITTDASLYITSNVGIGTQSPLGKLVVKSSAVSTTPLVVRRSTDANNLFYIGEDGAGAAYFWLFDQSGVVQTILNANGDSFTNRTQGNVGIGTSAPTQKLSVAGTINTTGSGDILAANVVYANGGGTVLSSTTVRGSNNSDFSFGAYGRNVITVDSGIYGVGIRGDGVAFASPDAAVDVGAFTRTSLPVMAYGSTNMGIKGSLEVDANIYVDTGIYLTNTTAAALYIRQPDGGCSKCGVDAAGTTWACANITCGAGM